MIECRDIHHTDHIHFKPHLRSKGKPSDLMWTYTASVEGGDRGWKYHIPLIDKRFVFVCRFFSFWGGVFEAVDDELNFFLM